MTPPAKQRNRLNRVIPLPTQRSKFADVLTLCGRWKADPRDGRTNTGIGRANFLMMRHAPHILRPNLAGTEPKLDWREVETPSHGSIWPTFDVRLVTASVIIGSVGMLNYPSDFPTWSAIIAPREPRGFATPSVVSRAVWCSVSAFSSPPRSTITAETHNHIMNPIPAPRDP